MAEMGHQLQLVGVTWLEDAMTERFVRVEERSEEGEDGERECVKGKESEQERERESSAARAQQHHRFTRQQRQHPSVWDSSALPREKHAHPNPYANTDLLEHAAALAIKSGNRITSHDALRTNMRRGNPSQGALQWKVNRLL